MKAADKKLAECLTKREEEGTLRTLSRKSHLIDFCSNDYLGFARSLELQTCIAHELTKQEVKLSGATGSRLITGNSITAEKLEEQIADFHNAESALIFNSGYDANVGFFSAVPQKDDVVLFDNYIHASVRDGIKMGRAEAITFEHNNVKDLKHKLSNLNATTYISVESMYSMDGGLAPLREICELAELYKANVVIDEAHATGLYGRRGEGRVQELGLENRCFARMHTFGKALGVHGAAIVGSDILKQFLINFARSFIYTTALPQHSLISIKCAYDNLSHAADKIHVVRTLSSLFQQKIKVSEKEEFLLAPNDSPIQSIVIPGNEKVKNISARLEKEGFYVKAIVYPTVPRGKERLRICLHAFNTEEEVLRLVHHLNLLQ